MENVNTTNPNSQYFPDFLSMEILEVSIINLKKVNGYLHPPYSLYFDVIYYIISGKGTREINGIKNYTTPGKIIILPRKFNIQLMPLLIG